MKAILPFSGFTETRYRDSGIEQLWRELLIPAASKDVIVYSPLSWREAVHPILAELRRAAVQDVMLIGYSWGAGVGCMRFASASRDYGITITQACLCDPVYRSKLLPTAIPINPLSLFCHPKIVIPTSVKRVDWVRQRSNIPKGHDLVPKCKFATEIAPPIILPTKHGRIDEHGVWTRMVEKCLNKYLKNVVDF